MTPVNPVLHVRIKSSELLTSELHLNVAGLPVVLLLLPRLTRLLVVVAKPRRADQAGLAVLRGYSTLEEIGMAYADTLFSDGPIEDKSVISYKSLLGGFVRDQFASLALELDLKIEVPELIECKAGDGYRIGVQGLEIVGLPEPKTR